MDLETTTEIRDLAEELRQALGTVLTTYAYAMLALHQDSDSFDQSTEVVEARKALAKAKAILG